MQDAINENKLTDDRNEGTEFRILTVSVDTPDEEWQKPRVYAGLDPTHFFNESPQQYENINPNEWKQKDDITKAYQLFKDWEGSDSPITVTFTDSDSSKTVKFNQISNVSTDPTAVTKDDVINNINYNTEFVDTSSGGVIDTFEAMLDEIRGKAFPPLDGSNASGAADSITYQDPLGEYMELKNGAIEVAQDASGNGGDVTGSEEKNLICPC